MHASSRRRAKRSLLLGAELASRKMHPKMSQLQMMAQPGKGKRGTRWRPGAARPGGTWPQMAPLAWHSLSETSLAQDPHYRQPGWAGRCSEDHHAWATYCRDILGCRDHSMHGCLGPQTFLALGVTTCRQLELQDSHQPSKLLRVCWRLGGIPEPGEHHLWVSDTGTCPWLWELSRVGVWGAGSMNHQTQTSVAGRHPRHWGSSCTGILDSQPHTLLQGQIAL